MRSTPGVLFLIACGSTSSQPDAATPTSEDIVCQMHTLTIVAADGAKTITDVRFALVDVSPTDDYWIEYCDYTNTSSDRGTNKIDVPTDPPCPTGATCTTSGAALPTPATACTWQHQNGTFLDGKLQVSCGSDHREYDAAGTLLFESRNTYGAIRLHRR